MARNSSSTTDQQPTSSESTNTKSESQRDSRPKIRTATAALKKLLERDKSLTGEIVTLRDPSKVGLRRKNGTLKVCTFNADDSLTQQQFKDDVEINSIVKRWKKTGQLPQTYNAQGIYADLSELPSLSEALQTTITAETAFSALPSQIRERFGHDPEKLISFLNDPRYIDESIQLGLRLPREQQSENQPNTNQNQPNSSTSNQPKQD